MKVAIHQRYHPRGQQAAMDLAAGCRRHGVEVAVVPDRAPVRDVDAACIWSAQPDVMRAYRQRRVPVLVAEAGYVGSRDRWTSLGWNGLNGEAEFVNASVSADRWQRYHADTMQPWRPLRDGYALVVGQVQGDHATAGVDISQWAADLCERLHAWTEVRFRPHPKRPGVMPDGVSLAPDEFATCLAEAAVVVTYTSTVGVSSVLAGLPTMAAGRISMAYPVSAHCLEDLWTMDEPDRETWAARLAYTQWTREEIASGEAWDHLAVGVKRVAA